MLSQIHRLITSPTVKSLILAAGVAIGVVAHRDASPAATPSPMPTPVAAVEASAQPSLTWAESTAIVVTRSGMGSGAIVSGDGWIITNAHVVAREMQRAAMAGESGSVKVMLAHREGERMVQNEDVLDGTVWAVDTTRDLALIRVDRDDDAPALPHFTLASGFRVGEQVWSIGSPGDALPWTIKSGSVVASTRFPEGVTMSVISRAAGGRGAVADEGEMNANIIATTTPIAPGDSGGPLVNDRGELIGLNFGGPAGSAQGVMAYHVALDEIRAFLDHAMTLEQPTMPQVEAAQDQNGLNKI